MHKIIPLLFCLVALTGCSALKESSSALSAGKPDSKNTDVVKPVALRQGIVFAKAVFEGVVKTSYVRLTIVSLADPDRVYNIYIGDKMRQQGFPWVEGVVSPEYFFIDLPAGEYRISLLAIPVGTVLAEEAMDITFRVEPDTATYLGDLVVRGTRERVRVGGIPVIQPGFEYTVEVTQNDQTALEELNTRLPRYKGQVKVQLMHVHPTQDFRKRILL